VRSILEVLRLSRSVLLVERVMLCLSRSVLSVERVMLRFLRAGV
jgi:hypothetical protein